MQRFIGLCLVSLWSLCSFVGLARATPADDEAARRHFESGRAYFERAEYDDAVREYEKAYALSMRPPLLVNISRAHESAGRPKEAAEALERWLKVSPPDDPMRADIESRHARLTTQANKLAEQAPDESKEAETPAEPAPAESEPDTAESSKLAPWLLIGGGGAVLASGVVVGFLGQSDISDVEDAKQGTSYSSVKDQVDSGPRKVVIGSVLAGVGAASAVAGLVWLLLSDDAPGESKAQVSVSAEGIQVWGRF